MPTAHSMLPRLLITDIFETSVPTADMSQVYIPLEKLQSMMLLPGEATILTFRDSEAARPALEELDIKAQNRTDGIGGRDDQSEIHRTGRFFMLYFCCWPCWPFLTTQILSIFRRQKEIGTYIALGLHTSAGGRTVHRGGNHVCRAGGPAFCSLWTALSDYGRQKPDGPCPSTPVNLAWP